MLKILILAFILIIGGFYFITSNGVFYFFGSYGFGGVHYECENIDFRLSYDGFSAIINNEYLPKDNWRLINDNDTTLKHYWVGSTHTYDTVLTSPTITYYVDGHRCEPFKE